MTGSVGNSKNVARAQRLAGNGGFASLYVLPQDAARRRFALAGSAGFANTVADKITLGRKQWE